MKKKELQAIANKQDCEITICRVLEKRDGYIKFTVDEGLSTPESNLDINSSEHIINAFLDEEQIDKKLNHVVACSFENSKIHYLHKDVMFKTFVSCFGSHRPLVLSPDIIWLLIAQTIAKHIDTNSEKLRDKFVNFDGQMDLFVESETDLFDKDTDWMSILQSMYNQIASHTKAGVAPIMRCDFTTTGANEAIASVATLMGSMKTYFRYHITHTICGIPSITLLGTEEDWKKILEKTELLKTVNLKSWYEWLQPILKEFVRASQGKPNLTFWKSIVMKARWEDFDGERGCIPDFRKIDGWCVALFPFLDGERQTLDECYKDMTMDSEMTRAKFYYHRIFPNGTYETFPMELWTGFIGVEEDTETFALMPKIGWFVRQSNEEEENLDRLRKQDKYHGIHLTVDVVPDILKKLDHINRLVINFTGDIDLPEWLGNMDIDEFIVYGKVSKMEKNRLKELFGNIVVNPKEYY